MISGWVQRVRHDPSGNSILHHFGETFWKVFRDDFAELDHHLAPLVRQVLIILVGCFRLALHCGARCIRSVMPQRYLVRRGVLDFTLVSPAAFFCGTIVSPRASIATSDAIFFARPSGVFMLLVRNASANRFCLLSVEKVFSARGFAA